MAVFSRRMISIMTGAPIFANYSLVYRADALIM
jgi:hypothetical protein